MSRPAPTIAAMLIALALAACGESEEENAQQTVCDAREDIANEIETLKGITPANFNADTVSESVSAIQSDLSQIKGAREDLSDDRRQEVDSANQAFESQVRDVAQQIGSGVAGGDAASTISAAAQQLASSYEQSFARIDCS
jgi:Tfp pilus assembly protein PilP